ncbi:NADPH oxidase 5-like [Morphnus guianensis]
MSAAEDAEWLRWVTKQFGSIVGEDKEIDLEEFKTALQVKESFFAERFFTLFDADGSGTISLEELLKALSLLVHGNEMDKLRFLFQVYDVDGSGSIDPDELRVVLGWCLRESAIALPEERLGDLTLALFEAADKDHSGSITFEELREELEGFPEVLENLTISAASWLKPPPPAERSCQPRYLTRAYWHNHRSKLAFLGGYAGLNLLLFTLAALRHVSLSRWLAVARGCGQCLNFNCAFLAVLMLRRCLTWLRATPIAKVLPLDQHVVFHQLVGYVVLTLAAVHTGAHIANFSNGFPAGQRGAPTLPHAAPEWAPCPDPCVCPGRLARQDGRHALAEYLLSARPGVGGLGGTASQTGLVLQGLLTAMLAFSSPCVRRSGHFEVFYWTHLSYISVWTLLILHGPHFWKWFAVPGCLFVLEKVVGLVWRRAGGLRIVEVNLLPSKVTHLVIERPQFFHYKPGDYIYLNIPAIATYEWHPFTISSAPEQQETLWLHIRSLGQWTNKLYEYFQQPKLPSLELKPLSRSLREKRCRRWEQEGLCSRAGSEGGSVATGGDRAVQLTSYKATGAAAPGHEDLPAEGVSTISHPCPAPPRPPRSLVGSSRAPGACRVGVGGCLCSHQHSSGQRTDLEKRGEALLPSQMGQSSLKGLFKRNFSDIIHGNARILRATVSSFWMRLETCAVWINPAGKKPPQNQTQGTRRFSISCHGRVRDGEETVTALFTLQVSIGLGETHRFCSIKCYIDGPYGTPTRRIFTSEHAVLIGAGIGITPFASILQSIMYRLVPLQQLRLRSCQQTPNMSSDLALGGTRRDVCHGRSILRHFSLRDEHHGAAPIGLPGSEGCGRWGRQGCACPCRYRRRKQSCPSCHYSWCEDLRDEKMTLRKVGAGGGGCRTKVFPGDGGRRAADSWGWRAHEHPFPLREVWGGGWLDLAPVLPASFEAEAAVSFQVDFIWINRDQKHFEWFVSLLTKLEMEQAEQEPGGRFLEMHMYMTSALSKNDMKAIGLQMALDLLAAKEQRDSITGLRTRTQPGRPDWSKVFGKVAEEKRGKVQVFFCGSPALAKVIRAHCERFGFRFFKENF